MASEHRDSERRRPRAGRGQDGSARRSARSRARKDGQGGGRFAAAARVADSNRAFLPVILFAALAAIVFLRLFFLQVVVAGEYSQDAQDARLATINVEARRGTIYDRNGNVLAISVDATTVYANPSEVDNPSYAAQTVAEAMGGEAEDYLEALSDADLSFSYLVQKADVEAADKLKELVEEREIEGIYFLDDTRREYPNGQVGGQVIGACEIRVDEESGTEYYAGISGLEAYYDDVLSGTPGRYVAERGKTGVPLPGGVHEDTPAVDGQDIVISLDITLQASVEESLAEGVENIEGTGGNAVVMDGATGEIYAAASLPYFNPADRSEVEEGATQLKCVTDLLEPGSIFKTVSTLALLETGTMGPDDELFCPAYITADGYTISDAHDRGDETMTLREILDKSSNVGISLAVEQMGFEELYNHILAYGLHKDTGVDYPGEGEEGTDALGYLVPFEDWSRVTAYNVSFGQGISVTPLQMVRFYGAINNDGVACTPHFLIEKPQTGEKPEYATEQIVQNTSVLPTMIDMLKTVVSDGTGTAAAIDGYEVAGKTSTAEIYDEENGGYREGVYNICFTGFIADSSSQLVCFVGANEVPGDRVVTPVFKDIMTTAIDRFKITPEQ
ncbi:MAG TPA: penicillin-binding protein 2 [Candidatus Aphodovivens avistercoris]|nr:penicillin-binding protein 2 [Candidatus Aphodovivens avistercoris]